MLDDEHDNLLTSLFRTEGRRALFCTALVLLSALVCVLATLYALSATGDDPSPQEWTEGGRPNVVFFIADGFGPEAATFIRTMLESRTLPLDEMIKGTVQTYSADNRITDSAAGATAYSCTRKVFNDVVAVLPDQTACGTLMEAAKSTGLWRTGVVTTTRITHATPAAWTSHVAFRDQEEDIALQQATQQSVDLLFGGGLMYYTNRSDGVNLFDAMQARGYTTASDYQSQFNNLSSADLPLIGLWAYDHIGYQIDLARQYPRTEPTLTEMVGKALDVLSSTDDRKPFFLLVEAGKVDLAEHVHDAASQFWELKDYMSAVETVKSFADKHKNTIVIAVADHETGGISLGAESQLYTYPKPYWWEPSLLYGVSASGDYMVGQIQAGVSVRDVLTTYANIADPTTEEVASIDDAIENGKTVFWISSSINNVVANRVQIGWTTPGHTGGDINLYTYGRAVKGLSGNMNNTRVGELLMDALGLKSAVTKVTRDLALIYNPETGTTSNVSTYTKKKAFEAPSTHWSHN